MPRNHVYVSVMTSLVVIIIHQTSTVTGLHLLEESGEVWSLSLSETSNSTPGFLVNNCNMYQRLAITRVVIHYSSHDPPHSFYVYSEFKLYILFNLNVQNLLH